MIKLEVGKKYLNHRGNSVTIVRADTDLESQYDFIGDDDCRYMEDGRFFWNSDKPYPLDLCEQVVPDHISSRHGIDEAMGGAHEYNNMTASELLERHAVCTVPRPLREYTSEERKGMPIYSGAIMYFPDALAAVSRVSKKANAKHNGPDAPLGWSRGKSTDQMDAAQRHMIEPGAIDADTGEIELAHGAWRVLAQLQLSEEKRLVAAGIKPLSGVTS